MLWKPSIQANRSRRASARVAWTRWWTRSTLSEWEKLSMGALSRQLPLRLIDGVVPAAPSASRQGSHACWTPRSAWQISPGAGRWRRTAISSASTAISACGVSRMAGPTILRVCRSRTAARNSRPSPVRT